jgi:hypothetical protein
MCSNQTNFRSDAVTLSLRDRENNAVSALYLVLHILRRCAVQTVAAECCDRPQSQ